MVQIIENPLCRGVYGDPVNLIRLQLLRPIQGAILTPEQSTFNSQMSLVCVCVEWGFGAITAL